MNDIIIKKINEHKNNLEIDDDKLDILIEYCNAIMEIYKNNYGESFNIDIDDDNHINIFIMCPIFAFVGSNNMFYELSDRALDFGFKYINEDCICLYFKFPSVYK